MIFTPILADFVSALLGFALFGVSLFLILLILVQRGRGGGLTGALGGPGGQSAFGTKAGDLFTRITSFVAIGWIALCAFTMWLIGSHSPSVAVDPTPVVQPTPAEAATGGVNELLNLGLEPGAMGGALTPSTPDTPATDAEVTTDADLSDPAPGTPPASDAPAAETPAAQATEAPASPPADAPAAPTTEAAAPTAAAPAETPNP